jgi:hypothetical protein
MPALLPLLTTHGMAMGSSTGRVLLCPWSLLTWGWRWGTWDSPIKDFVLLILPSLGQSPATSRKCRHLSMLADTWLHAAFLNVLSLIFFNCSLCNTYSHVSFPYDQSSPCLHPCSSSLIQITLLSCFLCKSEDMCFSGQKKSLWVLEPDLYFFLPED